MRILTCHTAFFLSYFFQPGCKHVYFFIKSEHFNMEIYNYWFAFETCIKWPFEELFSALPHLPLGFILAHSILHKCGYCGSTVCANAEPTISAAETHKLRSSLNTASLNTHAFKWIISHACLLKCYRKRTWKITAWNVDWNGCIPDCPQYARLLHPWVCI